MINAKSTITVIQSTINDRGMTLTHIAKNTGIDVDVLSKCLRNKRILKGDELISLAIFLNLQISDFATDSDTQTA